MGIAAADRDRARRDRRADPARRDAGAARPARQRALARASCSARARRAEGPVADGRWYRLAMARDAPARAASPSPCAALPAAGRPAGAAPATSARPTRACCRRARAPASSTRPSPATSPPIQQIPSSRSCTRPRRRRRRAESLPRRSSRACRASRWRRRRGRSPRGCGRSTCSPASRRSAPASQRADRRRSTRCALAYPVALTGVAAGQYDEHLSLRSHMPLALSILGVSDAAGAVHDDRVGRAGDQVAAHEPADAQRARSGSSCSSSRTAACRACSATPPRARSSRPT